MPRFGTVLTAAAGLSCGIAATALASDYSIEGDAEAMTLVANQASRTAIVDALVERFALGTKGATLGDMEVNGRYEGDLNHVLKSILPDRSYAIAYRDGRPFRISFAGTGSGAAGGAMMVNTGGAQDAAPVAGAANRGGVAQTAAAPSPVTGSGVSDGGPSPTSSGDTAISPSPEAGNGAPNPGAGTVAPSPAEDISARAGPAINESSAAANPSPAAPRGAEDGETSQGPSETAGVSPYRTGDLDDADPFRSAPAQSDDAIATVPAAQTVQPQDVPAEGNAFAVPDPDHVPSSPPAPISGVATATESGDPAGIVRADAAETESTEPDQLAQGQDMTGDRPPR